MKLINFFSMALVVITVIITIVFFGWWIMQDKLVFGDKKFDQVAWMTSLNNNSNSEAPNSAEQSNAYGNECKRGDMAYDLQQEVLLKNMPRKNVTALLGRPTFEDPDAIEYELGMCMHAVYGLRIYFDEQNLLTHSRISHH